MSKKTTGDTSPKPRRVRWLIAAAVIAVLLIVAAIVLRPYYAMPPESRDQLLAMLASYSTAAAAIEARPDDDRVAFEKMLGKMEILLDKPIDWREDTCPPRQFARMRQHEAKVRALPGFDRRLNQIVADGFVLRQEQGIDAEIFGGNNFRTWLQLELLLAADEARSGAPSAAVDRLDKLLTINEGFFKTPYLVYVLIGSRLEREIDAAILHALPRLAEDGIVRLRERLLKRGDPVHAFIDAMKTEVSVMVDVVTTTIPGPLAESDIGRALWNLAGALGYRDREILTYISLTAREAANFQDWYEAGGVGLPSSVIGESARYSFLMTYGSPDYRRMLVGPVQQVAARRAVLATLDAELRHRRDGVARPAPLTFAPGRRIEFGQDAYCLIEESPDAPEFY